MAQELTPWPISFCSEGRSSQRAFAPEATISVRVSIHSPSTFRRKGRFERSASMTSPSTIDGAETLGLLLHVLDQIGAVDAFGKAGKIFDFGGERKLAAGLVAFDDQRFQARARGVDGGGISGAAGTDDHNVMHVSLISEPIRCALMPLRMLRGFGGIEHALLDAALALRDRAAVRAGSRDGRAACTCGPSLRG